MSLSDRVKALSVPGVLHLVGGTGGEPAVMPDETIESLRLGLQQHKIEPHPSLTAGQSVRIRSGPFAGMLGVVTRQKGGLRVVLTLQQIMQSLSVEVDAADIEESQSVLPAGFDLAFARA